MLQSIQGDLAKQKQDMKDMAKNIKEAINTNIDEIFCRIELKTIELENKIERQQNTIDFLEKQVRKKNVVFFGVDETEQNYEELLEIMLNIINCTMKISCQKWEVETVTRIGKKFYKTRPVVVTISTKSRKIELFRKKKTLENSGIYIKEDYPPNVLQKRKELQDVLKQELNSGKRVALHYDKIVTLKTLATMDLTANTENKNKRFIKVVKLKVGAQ
ncbi:Endonuclease-reverse transcriptase [Operophtera brumata]|uniref:Endonuclease-reverse transcriptase n=1 Tax=Operophtera brumata TaxID=104452 RepID=A0A0L7LQQ8_OPEBR|nr:Endonuclease-reverse transcriptase [Operophtera brumata]